MHNPSNRHDRMIITQISDLHLRDDGILLKQKIDTEAALDAAISHINNWQTVPDAILVTGDLVQRAKQQNYGNLRKKLDRLCSPYYVIPGNYDNRALIREHFSDFGYLPKSGPFLHYSIDDGPLRLIGLDTMIPGENQGEICEKRCEWLDSTLSAKPNQPALIFMHHPLLKTGVSYLDHHEFNEGELLKNVIRRHSQVVWIACGHLHRHMHLKWAGIAATVSPSIAFQLPLALEPGAEKSFSLEPPGCPVYIWNSDIGLVSHMSLVGKFGELQPFVRDPCL